MSGHTPGPWHIEEESDGQSIVNRCFEGDEWCIAEVYRQTDIAIANANLIAAAPDLLEALENLADDISERFDMECPSTNPGIKRYVELARAAIAKARGGA